MTLRDATPSDADLLLSLERAANVPALPHIFPPDEYPYPDDDVRARWVSVLGDPSYDCHIAGVDGAEVGFVAWRDTTIHHLGVLPSAQRAGVGGALMQAALDAIAAEHAVARLWVLHENHAAIAFYEATGWTPTGASQTAEFPPYPVEVEYVLDLPPRR